MNFRILCIAIAFLAININADTASWIAPSVDYVGKGAGQPNGIKDWHIKINSSQLADDNATVWRVKGGLWYSMAEAGRWFSPYNQSFKKWNSYLKVIQTGSSVDLYFEPILAWPGMIFEVEALRSGQKTLTWQVLCSGQSWHAGGKWLGQGLNDHLSAKKDEGDGIREWQIQIKDSFLNAQPERVDVWLPYSSIGTRLIRGQAFTSWSSVASAKSSPLDFTMGNDEITLAINPVLATGGDEFFVRVVMSDKSWATWKIIGLGSDWQSGGKWYGQADQDFVSADLFAANGVKDWHLKVSSDKLVGPLRWIIRGAKNTWENMPADKKRLEVNSNLAHVIVSGTSADIYLDPVSERAGDIFYVSAILADASVISWGVTSVHQIRSVEVEWLGQSYDQYAEDVQAGTTNTIKQWQIKVEDDRLEDQKPIKWTITHKHNEWQEPRLTEAEINQKEALKVVYNESSANLFIKPIFAIAGDQYEVEALFGDGTLVQWTAVSDGQEWVSAADWQTDSGVDKVGLQAVPDGSADWQITITDDLFATDELVKLSVNGAGCNWCWPHNEKIAPISYQLNQTTANLYIAPISLQKTTGTIVTIKALFESGEVRYWKALQPK